MPHSRGPLILAGLWLLTAVNVQAQQGRNEQPSHELLPGVIDRAAAEKRLADRFQSSTDKNPLALLESLLKNSERYGITPKLIEEIARDVGKHPQDFPIDPTDPEVQKLARRLAEQANLRPDQLESLKKLIPDIKPPDVKPPEVKPPEVKPPEVKPPEVKPPEVKPPDMGNPPDMGKPPNMGGTTSGPRGDPVIRPGPAPKSRNKSWITRQLEELTGKDGIAGGLSEQLRGLIGPGSMLNDVTRDLTQETKKLTGKLLPSFEGLRLDGFLRDVNISPPRFDLSFSPPSFEGGMSMPSGSDLGSILLGVVLLGVIVLALVLLARSRGWVGPQGDGWRLGPWPVAPAAVRTRDDVVKAFEYLALLLLGRQAGSANHVDIASRMGADDLTGQRGRAAGELAGLYEHARYAPPDEALSDAEMEAARRDLTYLAGAAAA